MGVFPDSASEGEHIPLPKLCVQSVHELDCTDII